MQTKFLSAEEAVAYIQDGVFICPTGINCLSQPEELLTALEDRYLREGHPRGMTLVHNAGMGDYERTGYNHFGNEGMCARVIGSHSGASPRIQKLSVENKLIHFLLPQGVFSHLHHAAAAHQPGVLTKVGLKTFCDPRVDGCRANQAAWDSKEEVVSLMEVDGEEYLFYKAVPLDVCFLKGSYADEDGNISFENESVLIDPLEIASNTHNHGGKVFVQVDKIVKRGSLAPNNILIHNFMVDFVVVGKPENSRQSYLSDPGVILPEICGKQQIPFDAVMPAKLDVRKVCGRRAAMELRADTLVNLGFGMPDLVANVANEEGVSDRLTFSVESGPIGGVPCTGLAMSASYNYEARYRASDMMTLYDGGCLDMTCLGAAQVDAAGNVNVTKFGTRVSGPGGFINISQNAKKICYMGTLTTGGLKTEVKDGKLHIVEEGKIKKFVKEVEQISYSGQYGAENGQEVLYITERAVFKLGLEGLELIEIAPGVDLQKDILDQMEFAPAISPKLKLMDSRIFRDEKMELVLAE